MGSCNYTDILCCDAVAHKFLYLGENGSEFFVCVIISKNLRYFAMSQGLAAIPGVIIIIEVVKRNTVQEGKGCFAYYLCCPIVDSKNATPAANIYPAFR